MSHPRLQGFIDDPIFDIEIAFAEGVSLYLYTTIIIIGFISLFGEWFS
jgi:hypothetical protein